jgi:Txe/YoeB family toxin of toxin-antitoxin system
MGEELCGSENILDTVHLKNLVDDLAKLYGTSVCTKVAKDKKTANKIYSLIEDIRRNGAMQGIGKPEPLKHRSGYSRRIDDANHLVYEIDELQNINSVIFSLRT